MTDLIKAADALAEAAAPYARRTKDAEHGLHKALIAYRSARESAGEVKVKPLTFYRPFERETGYMIAETSFPNLYYETGLIPDGKGYYCKVRAKYSLYGFIDIFQSEELAQIAAQADYERRRRSALADTE